MPPLRRPGSGPEAEHPEYAGQYRLERRLGSGGMGVVHLSRSTSGMRLAVKVVHEELAADPEFRARFRQEVTAARRVSGAFTAPVVDADPDADRPWMATLYTPGPTLAEFVKRNGPVPPAQVRYLMAGLAEALRDIHRAGVVHRDLKPSNVLLAADGPKVIDFGISRPSDSNLRTETGKLIGTPPFMAPEQFRRPREVGPAADVFAMASVLVHAATGRSPFDSDSPYIVAYQVVHDEPELTGIPADLLPLIQRCLAKDPDDRPTSDALTAELRTDSASYDTQAFSAFDVDDLLSPGLIPQQRRATSAESTSGGEPASQSDSGAESARRRTSRILTAAAASAVLVAGGIVAMQYRGDPTGGHEPDRTAGSSSTGTFRPWSTVLRSGTTRNSMAGCTYAQHSLFCAQPGVNGAKVDPHTGLLQWSVHADGAAGMDNSPITPVLDAGVLRVATRDETRLEGLDPADGRRLWTFDISAYGGAYYNAGPSVLLVGRHGMVTAVDGRTGTKRWHKKLGGHSRPLFSMYPGSPTAYATEVSDDRRHTWVSAVDPADGRVRDQYRLDGELGSVGASATALYLASFDGYARTDAVIRLDLRDGSVRRVPLAEPLDAAQAVVQSDEVYVLGFGGALVAVDTSRSGATGPAAERWRLETSVSNGSRPVVSGDRLYFTAADGRLLAVDAQRGTFLGQTKPRLGTGAGSTDFPPAPVVADGKVFATAPDGSVFAVDAKDPSRW